MEDRDAHRANSLSGEGGQGGPGAGTRSGGARDDPADQLAVRDPDLRAEDRAGRSARGAGPASGFTSMKFERARRASQRRSTRPRRGSRARARRASASRSRLGRDRARARARYSHELLAVLLVRVGVRRRPPPAARRTTSSVPIAPAVAPVPMMPTVNSRPGRKRLDEHRLAVASRSAPRTRSASSVARRRPSSARRCPWPCPRRPAWRRAGTAGRPRRVLAGRSTTAKSGVGRPAVAEHVLGHALVQRQRRARADRENV